MEHDAQPRPGKDQRRDTRSTRSNADSDVQPVPPAEQDVTEHPMRSAHVKSDEAPAHEYERAAGMDIHRPMSPQDAALKATPMPSAELDGYPPTDPVPDELRDLRPPLPNRRERRDEPEGD